MIKQALLAARVHQRLRELPNSAEVNNWVSAYAAMHILSSTKHFKKPGSLQIIMSV